MRIYLEIFHSLSTSGLVTCTEIAVAITWPKIISPTLAIMEINIIEIFATIPAIAIGISLP